MLAARVSRDHAGEKAQFTIVDGEGKSHSFQATVEKAGAIRFEYAGLAAGNGSIRVEIAGSSYESDRVRIK